MTQQHTNVFTVPPIATLSRYDLTAYAKAYRKRGTCLPVSQSQHFCFSHLVNTITERLSHSNSGLIPKQTVFLIQLVLTEKYLTRVN